MHYYRRNPYYYRSFPFDVLLWRCHYGYAEQWMEMEIYMMDGIQLCPDHDMIYAI
jgi:hypothetical protein